MSDEPTEQERVARAIFESDFGHRHGRDEWAVLPTTSKAIYLRNADAAIAALRGDG